MYVLAIDTILVDLGSTHRRYYRGDELTGCPPDALAAMIRLKQAVPVEDVAPQAESEAKPEVQSATHEETPAMQQPTAFDWKQLPVASLEVEQRVKDILCEAGLTTVLAVLEYGAEHNGLTELSGIGKATETAINEAIKKVAGQ